MKYNEFNNFHKDKLYQQVEKIPESPSNWGKHFEVI